MDNLKNELGFITIHEILDNQNNQVGDFQSRIEEERFESELQRESLNELYEKVNKMKRMLGEEELEKVSSIEISLESINHKIELDSEKTKFNQLNEEEIIISSVAGIVSVIIDTMLVGVPNVEKVLGGQEKFTGSTLTKMIRNFGESSLGDFTKQLEKEFKVPYDKSLNSDGLTPNNHRLKSLSHDPFFGLFFSFFDFLFNTTTYVNNKGSLSFQINTSKSYKPINLFKSVYYFMGHILSDMYTARGIPIPGFFMSQFFVDEAGFESLAKKAEGLYKDGYDLRHLQSMMVPGVIIDLIITVYMDIKDDFENESLMPQAHKEIKELDRTIKKEKMMIVANSISASGNLVKFISPVGNFNPASLNVLTWYRFLDSSVQAIRIAGRDTSTEHAISNREIINKNWEKLKG